MKFIQLLYLDSCLVAILPHTQLKIYVYTYFDLFKLSCEIGQKRSSNPAAFFIASSHIISVNYVKEFMKMKKKTEKICSPGS